MELPKSWFDCAHGVPMNLPCGACEEDMMPETIENTLAERGARYGDFTDHAQLSDDLQRRCEQSPNWGTLPAWQRWGLRIVLDKIARMLTGDPGYVDNAHDMVGYSKLIEDRLVKQERAKNGPELPGIGQ